MTNTKKNKTIEVIKMYSSDLLLSNWINFFIKRENRLVFEIMFSL